MDTLAKRVEFLVLSSGLRAKPLSKLCDLGETHLGMFLRGDVTHAERPTCEKVAAVTGCSWLWLMHGEGVAPPPPAETVRASVEHAIEARKPRDTETTIDRSDPDVVQVAPEAS